MDARDEVVLALTEDIDSNLSSTEPHSESTQRLAVIGHYGFRCPALLIYLFCTWFTSSFILPFIIILVCLSLDMWFTKNISGRVMVGLRWSSYTSEQGEMKWRFDARPPSNVDLADPAKLTRRELILRANHLRMSRLFWTGLVGSVFIWSLFLLTSLFTLHLQWSIICLIALFSNVANLYGYIRCRLSNLDDNASNTLAWIKSTFYTNVLPKLWTKSKQANNPSTMPV